MRGLIARYALTGIANTLFGYGVIVAGLLAGMTDYAANALGYAAGFVLSFALNRRFTYRVTSDPVTGQALRFCLAAALAYGANLAVLTLCIAWLGEQNPLAHMPGMIAYSGLLFVLSTVFVFSRRTPG